MNFKLTGDYILEYNGRVEIPECSFNREDIIHLLRSIKPTKAPGPDNVYPKVLVECAEELADIILTIFKSTYDSGFVPLDWKLANVINQERNVGEMHMFTKNSIQTIVSGMLGSPSSVKRC